MKKLFLSLVILFMFSGMAIAYTFDGNVNPVQFFKYTLADQPEQTGPGTFTLSLKSDNMNPLFAINGVFLKGGKVFIVAYAYYDKMVLRNFELIGNHYTETLPAPNIIEMLRKKLNKLHGISDI
jgi:hypothetical protein